MVWTVIFVADSVKDTVATYLEELRYERTGLSVHQSFAEIQNCQLSEIGYIVIGKFYLYNLYLHRIKDRIDEQKVRKKLYNKLSHKKIASRERKSSVY